MKPEYKIEICGRVVHGDHYGKVLGFPTANIDRRDYSRRKLKIRFGIWAGAVAIQNLSSPARPGAAVAGGKLKIKNYRAGIVVGPVDKTGLPKIEAHLVNFKGDLYGKKINIYLYRYLRAFKKFKNAEDLKKQIRADIARVRKITL